MVESLKDLEKLLKLCRKQGVLEISLGSVSLKLGDVPRGEALASSDESETLEDFPDDILSTEELTFFANGGLPKENPFRADA